MSVGIFNDLKDLNPGSFNWKIKVRVIRFWRGVSRSGEIFKGFNLLLLDDKNDRIHGFVPGALAEKLEDALIVGKIFSISNFTVKEYRSDEKFRCVHNNKQIILTSYTKVKQISEKESFIADNMFDFFDFSDLKSIANKNVYLTDVIGVIQQESPLREFKNRNGEDQCHVKILITDGRCSINVTIWDELAKELDNKLNEDIEIPKIIIIASAKVTSWEFADTTEISNVSATKFYLNYPHHSVSELRKMISTPLFSKYHFSSQLSDKLEKLTAQQIKTVGPEYIEKEVLCHLKFQQVHEINSWYRMVCTTCFREIRIVDGCNTCVMCNRNVPYPDRKFNIVVDGLDETENLGIMLEDGPVRSLIGKTVFDLEDEGINMNEFPQILKTIENKEYTVKVKIIPPNMNQQCTLYKVTDIYDTESAIECPNPEANTQPEDLQHSMTETSTSTFHLDGLSQMTFTTPEVTNQRSSRKLCKKKNS